MSEREFTTPMLAHQFGTTTWYRADETDEELHRLRLCVVELTRERDEARREAFRLGRMIGRALTILGRTGDRRAVEAVDVLCSRPEEMCEACGGSGAVRVNIGVVDESGVDVSHDIECPICCGCAGGGGR